MSRSMGAVMEPAMGMEMSSIATRMRPTVVSIRPHGGCSGRSFNSR